MTALKVFTLPPDTQVPLAGDPAGNANAMLDALATLGTGLNVLNTATAFGGADPSGVADSTAAFTAAGSGGGNVLVPPGTYLIDGAAAIALSVAGTILVGCGKDITTLKIGGSLSAAQVIAITANFCGVKDLSIIGASSTITSNPAADGINVTGAQFCQVRDVFWQYVNGWCVNSVGGSSQANIGCRFDRLTGYNVAGGIHAQGVTGSAFGGQQWITDPQFSQVGVSTGAAANRSAIFIEDISDVFISNYDGAISDVATGSTLHIKGLCSNIIVNGYDLGAFPDSAPANTIILIEDSTNGSPTDIKFAAGTLQSGLIDLAISGGATRVTFTGTNFKNAATHGAVLSGTGSGIYFTNCVWSGNGAGASGTNYDLSITGSCTGKVDGCHFLSPVTTTGTAGVQDVVGLTTSGLAFPFTNTEFLGSGVQISTCFTNLPSVVRNCKNYNPHGAVSPASIPVPASGSATTGLHYDSTFYITAANSGGNYLAPPVSYAPSSVATLTTTSATLAAVSSGNVNTGSFVAPPSGNVLVTASFVAEVSVSSTVCAFGLAAHGTVTPVIGDEQLIKIPSASEPLAYNLQFEVTGLTPGTSYNFDLLFAVNVTSTPTLTIQAFGQTSTTPTTSGTGAPVLMTVESTPTDSTGGCTIVTNTAGQGGGTGATITIPPGQLATIDVPAQATITPTYTQAPTWVANGK